MEVTTGQPVTQPVDHAGLLEQSSAVLDTNIVQLQGLYASAGNTVASALETFKVFKPEITRLDAKTSSVEAAVGQLGTGLQKVKDEIDASLDKAGSRLAAMEQRMMSFEAFIAAMPTWKTDLVSKIDSVGKEARLKGEQLTLKTTMLEDSHMHHIQATRERLDTLTSLAKTATEARAQQGERIDKLEGELRQLGIDSNVRMNELEMKTKKHDEGIAANHRYSTELNIKLGVARVDIDALKERATLLEDSSLVMRTDLSQLRDRQDSTDNSLSMAATMLNKLEITQGALHKRIEVVERDPRIPRLLASVDELKVYQQDNEKVHKAVNTRIDSFEKQLTRLDNKVDRGPPGLWKVTEQVAKQAEELEQTRSDLRDAQRHAENLERSLQEARSLLGQQRDMHSALQQETQELQDRLAAGLQRGIRYADTLRDTLVAKHELEALRTSIIDVKKELQQGITAMGIRVKFDLLHDETPQVASIREYLQSVDAALARSREKIAVLEEGMMREHARGRELEAGWSSTKEALDALVLTGELDVHALRRDLRSVKAMFEEMGRLSLRGDIITAKQAAEIVEEKLNSVHMDTALSRRLHDGGPLAAVLSGLAPKYEVESLRKMVLQCRQEILAGASAAAAANPQLPGSRPQSAVVQSSVADGSAGDKPPLRELYMRLAAAEEAASCSQQHCSALEARLTGAEAALAAAAPTSSTAIGVTPTATPEGSTPAVPSTSTGLESFVREVVNRTLLPEVMTRQAADTQRLLRYIGGQAARAAKSYEVQAVRSSMAALRSEVECLRQQVAGDGSAAASGGGGWQERVAAAEEQLMVLSGRISDVAAGAVSQSHSNVTADSVPQAEGEPAAKASSSAPQQAEGEGRLRAVEARLATLEGQLSERVAQGVDTTPEASQAQQHLLELKAVVTGLSAQQPLLAKTFEVEDLRQSIEELRQQLVLQATAVVSERGPPVPALAGAEGQAAAAAEPSTAGGATADDTAAALAWRGAVSAQLQQGLADLRAQVEADRQLTLQHLQQLTAELAQVASTASLSAASRPSEVLAEGTGDVQQLQSEAHRGEAGADSAGPAAGEGQYSAQSAAADGQYPAQSAAAEEQAASRPARALQSPEHVDTELAGLAHDLVNAAHDELATTPDGPLPGATAGSLPARQVREAALRRLRAKPLEFQRHVELLEKAKQQLSRLVNCAAASTVDYLCLGLVMLDIKVKLLEDAAEQQREQLSTVFNNLESAFEYLRKLQEAMDTKASASAVAGLDRALRAMAKECMTLGPAQDLTGRDGALTGSRLCAAEFWAALLGEGPGGGNSTATSCLPTPGGRDDGLQPSPARVLYAGRSSPQVGSRSRPPTARSQGSPLTMAPLPSVSLPGVMPSSPKASALLVSAGIHPPPNFYKEKRNIQEEQERAMAVQLQAAEQQGSPRQQWPPDAAELTAMLARSGTSPAQRSSSPSSRPSSSSVQRPRTAMHRSSSPHYGLQQDSSLPPLSHLGGGMSLVPLKHAHKST